MRWSCCRGSACRLLLLLRGLQAAAAAARPAGRLSCGRAAGGARGGGGTAVACRAAVLLHAAAIFMAHGAVSVGWLVGSELFHSETSASACDQETAGGLASTAECLRKMLRS